MLPVTDREQALGSVQRASARFASLLKEVDDASANAIGEWNVGEVAAHVSQLVPMFAAIARGEGSHIKDHLKLDEAWARQLEVDTERDLTVLAGRIERGTSEFLDAVGSGDWRRIVSWHGAKDVPLYTLASLLINECDVHGLDISAAAGRPWDISSRDATIIVTGLFPLLPYYFNTEAAGDLRATFALHLRKGSTVYARVEDGRLEVSDKRPSSVDVHISVAPVEYLLVAYGRKSQWGPILTGKIAAYGRRPWLAPKFAKLFYSV